MIYRLPSRLKELRQSMNLRQEQLARLIGVERSTISSYESNMRQPSLETLSRIADVFGVSTDYLLGRTDHLSLNSFDLEGEDAAMLYKLVSMIAEKNRKIRQSRDR